MNGLLYKVKIINIISLFLYNQPLLNTWKPSEERVYKLNFEFQSWPWYHIQIYMNFIEK